MMNQVTREITDITKIKIVCGRCEKRAEILWHEAPAIGFFFAILRVRCHGDDRIVEVTQYHQRVAELSGFDELALLWEQLATVDPLDFRHNAAIDLRRAEEYAEQVPTDVSAEHEQEIRDELKRLKSRLQMVRELLEARVADADHLPRSLSPAEGGQAPGRSCDRALAMPRRDLPEAVRRDADSYRNLRDVQRRAHPPPGSAAQRRRDHVLRRPRRAAEACFPMTIQVHDASMSDPYAKTRATMAMLMQEDAEGWARLSGLMAVLALPPVRGDDRVYRRPPVEVEVAEGIWTEVDSVAIEADRLIMWFGTNGVRQEYVFARSEGIPKWRQR